MAQIETATRYQLQVPAEVGQAIDVFAKRVNLSRNKAAAVLIRKGIEAEKAAAKRMRELVTEIRSAATDEEAEKHSDELIELTFGRQKKRKN